MGALLLYSLGDVIHTTINVAIIALKHFTKRRGKGHGRVRKMLVIQTNCWEQPQRSNCVL